MSDEPFVDINVAAAFIGTKPGHLRQRARAGEIPGHQEEPGRAWKFRLSELEKWQTGEKARPRGRRTSGRQRIK